MDRVLLGAIFRKLPLKLLLVILAVVAFFVAYTKADNFESLIPGELQTITVNRNSYYTIKNLSSSEYSTYCIYVDSIVGGQEVFFGFNSSLTQDIRIGSYLFTDWPSGIYQCLYVNLPYLFFYNGENTSKTITFKVFDLIDFMNSDYPNYTSLQCQSEYNLIPINEVDNAYCESNNLCSSSSSPSDCPNVGVSNLFINDVFHPGAYNVIMNIPEEIDWDYAYTNSGSNINIDVVGYNQDAEYINGLIDINNYKPTSSDFSKVFGLFDNYGGLLVACLFIILIFYFIKKSFK